MTLRRRYNGISPHQNHIRWYFIFGPPLLFCYDMIGLAFVQHVMGKKWSVFFFFFTIRTGMLKFKAKGTSMQEVR